MIDAVEQPSGGVEARRSLPSEPAGAELEPAEYAYDDLRGFIAEVERIGELKRIDGAHWDLEIGGLTELYAERRGPALLFDDIPGYPRGYRVLSNAFSSYNRTALAFHLPLGRGGLELLNLWRQRLRRAGALPPREVSDGPLFERSFEGAAVDLYCLPTPRWHDLDGGRYLGTADAVITRDPEDGWVNVGTYRGMIHDRNHLGVKVNKGKHGRIHLDKWHAQGEACPMAIAFGFAPSLWVGVSNIFVPWGVSEYEFAGWLRGRPVEVVRGPLTGLPLPATAEVVVEGRILPPDQVPYAYQEGPFGEWLGYYADTTTNVVPVMEVQALFHRKDPILLGAPPLKPPAPWHFALAMGAAGVWDELERAGVPDVKGVWMHASNWGPLFLVVAIKQRYAGHARQAGLVATGCRTGAYGGRFTVVVDDDVDITNLEEVVWAMATRCRVEQDIDIVRGVWQTPGDPLLTEDERVHEENTAARAIIDACRPYRHIKEFPPVNAISPALRKQLVEKWGLR
jgi:UbiD family decarboxylase